MLHTTQFKHVQILLLIISRIRPVDLLLHHDVQIEKITGRSRACFEPTLVTRYRPGDRQRRHFDTPLPGDESLEDFESSGLGQRLVQCVVYLNDLPEGGGGETMFHHPDLSGLKVTESPSAKSILRLLCQLFRLRVLLLLPATHWTPLA